MAHIAGYDNLIMKKSKLLNILELNFCFRRAWRFGILEANDLCLAFGLNERTARRRINEALNVESAIRSGIFIKSSDSYGEPYLIRKGHFIRPNKKAEWPECASEKDLLDKIGLYRESKSVNDEQEFLFYALTGLHPSEINIRRYESINNEPGDTGDFLEVIRAIQNKPSLIRANYTSLNHGDNGKSISFVPLSIQIIGEQINIYAYKMPDGNKKDVRKENEKIRIYVLSRLSNCSRASFSEKKSQEIIQNLPVAWEGVYKQQVYLNSDYTENQKRVISSELNIKNNNIELPKSRMFQFLRQYANIPSNGIWPPLVLPTYDMDKYK